MTRHACGGNSLDYSAKQPGRGRPRFHRQFPQIAKLPYQSFGKTINNAKVLTGDADKAIAARLAAGSGARGFSCAEEDSGGAS